MVFGDYELVGTNRVNVQRRAQSVWLGRLWNSAGGYNTFYLAVITGCVSHSFGFTKVSPMTVPILSRAGI